MLMPHDTAERDGKLFDQLCNQMELLEQDIGQAIEEKFMFDEVGLADNRKAWFMQGSVPNTAALFRQELLGLTCLRFPWATTVELKLSLDKLEPYQYVYVCLSPLPLLP